MKHQQPNIIVVKFVQFLVPLLLAYVVIGSAFRVLADQRMVLKPFAQGSISEESPELVRNTPIERQLGTEKIHTYRVTATAGQYFRVVVRQNGIDVVVRLIGPDEKMIIEVDSPNNRNGPEPVSEIAKLSGYYRLEVRALDAKAIAGRYEIKLLELREPQAADRDRVTVERLLADAEQLHAQKTKESLHKAIEKYKEALPILRAVGDQWKEAETHGVMGLVYFLLGEMPKALNSLQQALPLRRLAGDRYGEKSTLNGIGTIYGNLGEPQKALQYYEQALSVDRELGDRLGEAFTLRNIGNSYGSFDFRKAVEYLNRSLSLSRELQARGLEGEVLAFLGRIYLRYGEPQLALEYHHRALQLQRAVGDKWEEARTLGSIAHVYGSLSEIQKSLEYFNQSLVMLRATGNRLGEAQTLASIGWTYISLGDPRLGITFGENALLLTRALKTKPSEAYAAQVIALASQHLGELQQALAHLNLAASLYREGKDQISEARALAHAGAIQFLLGRSEEAISSLKHALRHQRVINDRLGEASSLSQLGAIYGSLGRVEEAVTSLQQALSVQRLGGDNRNEAVTLYRLAKVERNRGRFETARKDIETALRIIEGNRNKLFDQQLRTSFSAFSRDYYELYIDVLMEMHRSAPAAGYDAIALQVNERGRARSLFETLIESHADIRQGVDPLLLDRQRSLQQQLNAKADWLTRLLNGKHTEKQAKAARQEVQDRLSDYREIETQIRAKSPRYAALTQPEALSLNEIQQQVLDQDTVLIEYVLGERISYAFVVSDKTITSYELPKRADIEQLARRVYTLLINKADALYPEALTSLSQAILQPMATRLTGKRLLIVGDGALQYVPFGALPQPILPNAESSAGSNMAMNKYQPLILTHEVITLPSASVLAVQRQQMSKRVAAPKKLVVFADPVFAKDDRRIAMNGGELIDRTRRVTKAAHSSPTLEISRAADDLSMADFKRLPLTRREAELITKGIPTGKVLKALDFAASKALATSPVMSQYQIVHFATHSLLNNSHPELSGIVLSLVDHQGRSQDGFLRLNEIYNLHLEADLVVLSACQTALGREVKGEGLIGLTRGFMYAGAPRVVASVWKVSEGATTELMTRFYDKMLNDGMPASPALRAAQLSLIKEKQWSAPYYWAAFVLQGEWR